MKLNEFYLAKYTLECAIFQIQNSLLTKMCNDVIGNPLFKSAPGSSEKHHAYEGGLFIHTAEVVKYALAQAEAFRTIVNYDVLITAAIFHDFLKYRDYSQDYSHSYCYTEQGNKIVKTDYHAKIGHVAGSYAAFVSMVADYDYHELGTLSQQTIDDIGHCILSHHGRKEWGTPVVFRPQTLEAQILHHADMLSYLYGENR